MVGGARHLIGVPLHLYPRHTSISISIPPFCRFLQFLPTKSKSLDCGMCLQSFDESQQIPREDVKADEASIPHPADKAASAHARAPQVWAETVRCSGGFRGAFRQCKNRASLAIAKNYTEDAPRGGLSSLPLAQAGLLPPESAPVFSRLLQIARMPQPAESSV
eukprot:scaffold388_cov244-Pinguiococcus_pyrenoidosus.AAC.25